MTYPGAPSIYYGDEIGFGMAVPVGERPRWDPATDPDTRRAFPWNEAAWNHDLRAYVKQCIELRHAYPALRRGEFIPLHADGSLYVFCRKLDEDVLVVALNAGDIQAAVYWNAGTHLRNGSVLHDVWKGDTAHIEGGRMVGGYVPPRTGRVWTATVPSTSALTS
jgi:glycosidase